MGRTRQVSKDDILDAAERVVVRLGAAALSIDAVAKEAGVSKATVVYDHKSKSALLAALIDRRIAADIEHVNACVGESLDAPHPELFGRIKAAESEMDETDRAVALAVSVAMSTEADIQKTMRQWVKKDLDAVETGERSEAALMAYLALTGMCCTELFDFHTWSDKDREKILNGVRSIYLTFQNKY